MELQSHIFGEEVVQRDRFPLFAIIGCHIVKLLVAKCRLLTYCASIMGGRKAAIV